MQFTLENETSVYTVRAYSAQAVRIGENEIHTSCLVSAERLITEWPPQRFEGLERAHLEAIFALQPQVVLIGTGLRQQFASAELRAAFTARGVGLEVMDLGAACRTFNVLVHEGRSVVAALFFE